MTRVHAAVGRNINSAAEENINEGVSFGKKEVRKMVEFDAIKQSLANYAQPLLEMGDSL